MWASMNAAYPLTDEAHVLRTPRGRHIQAGGCQYPSCLGARELPENGPGQRSLPDQAQEVFSGVRLACPRDVAPSGVETRLHVMARGWIRTQCHGSVEQQAEFLASRLQTTQGFARPCPRGTAGRSSPFTALNSRPTGRDTWWGLPKMAAEHPSPGQPAERTGVVSIQCKGQPDEVLALPAEERGGSGGVEPLDSATAIILPARSFPGSA